MTNITEIRRTLKQREETGYWYGIEEDTAQATPDFTRIGDMAMHQELPIQKKMKRCLLLDSGEVNYYTGAIDGTKKEDGTTAADLSGVDGQWQTEVPAHYYKEEHEGTIVRYKFSELPVPGFTYIQKHYVSAGEAAIHRPTGKLACVVNNSADYRGGDNNSSYDGQSNTLLGRPVTDISLTDSRSAAQLRGTGWITEIPTISKAWRRLLFCEYATRNIQQPFNPNLDANGCKQGGLGPGVTTASSSEWSNFNGYRPFVPIGVTSSLGNATGVASYVATDFGGAGVNRTFEVPSYRGIENPFGHIWKWWDGYNLYNDGSNFTIYERDSISGLADATSTGYTEVGTLPLSNGYATEMNPGLLLPSLANASSTTKWCDYYYAGSTGWRVPLVGGTASAGASAGLVYVYTFHGASRTYTTIGSRLCFFGA